MAVTPPSPGATPARLQAVLDFWRAAGARRWFKKDEDFDTDFRTRFLDLHNAAARGECDADAAASAEGALAVLLLLDQFPRNAFRDSARAFATDGQACDIAAQALAQGYDLQVEAVLRPFFYMPFMHSEVLADQERCVALFQYQPPEGDNLRFAILHRDIVQRFGRFPHRNAVLGRSTTEAEQAFLDGGGFAG